MLNYTLSGFSDEIDPMIEAQFEHLNKLGIKFFEPRGINGVNISDISDEECSKLLAAMEKYGIKVSSIGSPIGKIGIEDDFEQHKQKLRRTIELAKKLGTKYIRVFSFYIPEGKSPADYRNEVISRMQQMCEIAEAEGVILLHENEKGIYGDTADRCADILKSVNSDNLRAVFDPANFVQCGQKTFPDAFEMLVPYIEYMHIKDAKADGSVVPSGHGIGHIYEILNELKKRNYSGFLSLEPHLGQFSGLAALEQNDGGNAVCAESSDADKFTLAYKSLMDIIERVNENE